jgi:hypothetical protein
MKGYMITIRQTKYKLDLMAIEFAMMWSVIFGYSNSVICNNEIKLFVLLFSASQICYWTYKIFREEEKCI